MSSKTQKKAKAKTKSAPKFLTKIVLICLLVVFLLMGLLFKNHHANQDCIRSAETKCAYKLDVADNEEEQALGLSFRDNMAQDRGMLFIFDQADKYCFWMKDMRFNLDIIWLDSNKDIVKVMENVEPATYPENFCPANPAKYVIELNSGEAKKQGYQLGYKIDF